MVSALDDFKEESRPIFERLRENLKEISFVIVVDENFVPLKGGDILFDLESYV